MYELYIGNKNYSSWSLRPWLLLRHCGIPFVERNVQLSGSGAQAAHRPYSDNGLVPCLHDGDFRVWDSLAIAEYLAERHPGLWPDDPRARARARCVSAEMHSGFAKMRQALPMNIKLRLRGRAAEPEVQADIERIVEIWDEARSRFAGDGGPWLFGRFSVADAMYAPVVWRFHTYAVPLPEIAARYRDAMLAHPEMRAWEAGALAETVAMPYDALAGEYGGPR